MTVSKLFIERPIATAMVMLAVVLLGSVGYSLLPVAALPRVDFPTIQVNVSYPGASPETMAALVATPLERQFGEIPGVTQMTSASALGASQITLQFDLSRNLDGAAQDVQTAINAAAGQLPKDLPSPPTYRKTNPADTPIMVLAATSDTMPLTRVDDLADTILAQRISQVPGVGLVTIAGEQKPAVRIQVNPDKVAALGLGLEDVNAALTVANVERPKGTLEGASKAYTLDANDQLPSACAYEDIIVGYRNGGPVRVRDIGRAVDAPENVLQGAWYDKRRAVLLAVQREPGANVIATVDAIQHMLPQLEKSIPPAVKVSVIQDRTQTIRASVADVQFTMMLTIGLVVMVILVFLRNLWGTVIPSVTVPLSIVGAFGIMYALGFSLDNLSLMGLTIAVGFVVDDAIVVVENIERHIGEGMTPIAAAIKGAGEIGFTIVSISLSLIAVFIPLLLMSGYVGELFREFAVTVAIAIVMSMFVSLTLTPMMSGRLLRRAGHGRGPGRISRALERFFNVLLAGYERSLTVVFRHQRLTLGIEILIIGATVALYVVIPKGFFPEQDTGTLFGTSVAAEDISFQAMAARQQAAVDVLLQDPAIAGVGSFIGSGGANPVNQGRMFIALKPRTERDASAAEIVDRLRPKLAQIPGVTLYLQALQDVRTGGRLTRTEYQFTLQDADLHELDAFAPRVLTRLETLPGLADVTSDQASAAARLVLRISRDAASKLGITPDAIDATLYDAFGQRQISTIYGALNQYHVVLEVDPRFQLGPDALQRIYVKAGSGTMVPLSAVVSLEPSNAPLVVNHQGSFPSVTISFNLAPGVALGQAVTEIDQAMRALGVPPAMQYAFQGTAQAFQSSLSSEPILVLASIIAIYVILAILYESLVHPLTIISTMPSAGLGALLTLLLFREQLTVMALVGIILLMGIVKKNGIMMVDFALAAERQEGLPPERAIFKACVLRFRPIMMTTMSSLLGGLPLVLADGTGTELRRPLGLAIVGGLLVSQALTLYTTPIIYLMLERLRQWLQAKPWHRPAPPALAGENLAPEARP